MKNNDSIEYPTCSKRTYKGILPFIRIYQKDCIYYGFYDKDIILVELHQKPIHSKLILKNAILPNTQYLNIFNQATKQIRGIQYQILYVSNNQYLCIGYLNEQIISFVLFTIELNTKGYYEIINIKKVV